MPEPVISVENLSKAYRIGLKEEIPDTLMGAVAGVLKAPLRNWWRLRRLDTFVARGQRSAVSDQHAANGPSTADPATDTIWALKNVSFEITQGEVVGIIGRNGAGKSTLLKILSRITEPTSGRAVIRGRISSLLEVGTGFHPELSGRENIYMNGTILGMTKREIDRKFDEIVEFSGVEKFLDTPTKRYSSGMQVRLAFAVAAHLEPEILIVDEVLAVGDAEFQKKCLGKMQNVAVSGRTVLFVSHNMPALTSLCSRAFHLAAGALVAFGSATDVVASYLSTGSDGPSTGFRDVSTIARNYDQRVRFRAIELLTRDGDRTDQFSVGEAITVRLHMESMIEARGEIGYTIKTAEGFALLTSSSNDTADLLTLPVGHFTVETTMNPNLLRPGRYLLQVGTTVITCEDLLPEAITFDIVANRHYSSGYLYNLPGHVHVAYEWKRLSQSTRL